VLKASFVKIIFNLGLLFSKFMCVPVFAK
jgi:hypothetical protein